MCFSALRTTFFNVFGFAFIGASFRGSNFLNFFRGNLSSNPLRNFGLGSFFAILGFLPDDLASGSFLEAGFLSCLETREDSVCNFWRGVRMIAEICGTGMDSIYLTTFVCGAGRTCGTNTTPAYFTSVEN